jgi:hypothetical protein
MNEKQLLERVNSKRNGCRGQRLGAFMFGLVFPGIAVLLCLKVGPELEYLLLLIPALPFLYLALFAEDQTVDSWFDTFSLFQGW